MEFVVNLENDLSEPLALQSDVTRLSGRERIGAQRTPTATHDSTGEQLFEVLGGIPHPTRQSPVVHATEEPVELSRIRTRSGITIEISDGPVGQAQS